MPDDECAFSGCSRPRLTNRMFCSRHVDAHGVSPVASVREHYDFGESDAKEDDDDKDRGRKDD
jgi:hypothetical protein